MAGVLAHIPAGLGVLEAVYVTLLSSQVDEVQIPGSEGYFGVLPGHTPFLATLAVGLLALLLVSAGIGVALRMRARCTVLWAIHRVVRCVYA